VLVLVLQVNQSIEHESSHDPLPPQLGIEPYQPDVALHAGNELQVP
jgi:hypothetical protein